MLSAKLSDKIINAEYELHGSVAVFKNTENGEILNISGENWTLKSIKLLSFTDSYDTLTEERRQNLFSRSARQSEGGIFFLENHETDEAIFIASEAPEYVVNTLSIEKGKVILKNEENTAVIGFSCIGEVEALCRSYFRSHLQYKTPFTMSNTWGDCHGFTRVCEDFVLKEIEVAGEIGLDAMQIDDGWQVGNTADPAIFDETRHRMFKDGFWELSLEKFPNGMRLVTDKARDAGVKIGLWFAPDSHGTYATLERDLKVLEVAYREWGVRFFKLDMYWIHSKEDKEAFLSLVKGIYAFGDDVSVELDVTRDIRVNYLFCKEYGTVFVENRYTKMATYFPHRTLRNLWSIARYLPTARFQFELVNPDLYKESYKENDCFAPSNYGMDYLFASVMLSCPLFWMELQNLPMSRREELKPIMDVFKKYRNDFADADVIPIGDEPSGRSFTGFHVKCKSGKEYLLLFREVCEQDSREYSLKTECTNANVLISNAACTVLLKDGRADVSFSNERAYAFVELK